MTMKHGKKMLRYQSGISLVELMLAMAVFSFMLLIIVKGVIGVVRVQQAGVVSRNTQQNARLALEQMVREARAATDAHVLGAAPQQTVCLVTSGGLIEYYVPGGADNRLHRATVDYNSGFDQTLNTCKPQAGVSFSSDSAITSADVAVVDFESGVSAATPPDISFKLRISTQAGVNSCSGGSGSQFCSVTELNSTVSLRGTP